MCATRPPRTSSKMGQGCKGQFLLRCPMTRTLLITAAFTLVLLSAASPRAIGGDRSLAGWYDLFTPYQKHFHPMYDKPVVAKKEGEGATYSQAARFDQMTNLPRAFSATAARDPGFKKRFGRESMKDAPATALEIGKRTAWVWNDQKKVVVPLGEDKAVLLELDPHSQPMALVDYAKSLDYDRIEKALDKPPRTDYTPTVETFSVLKKGEGVSRLQDWAGVAKSHEQVGRKEDDRVRWVYALKDGTSVGVTTAAGGVERITHEAADGTVVELLK